MFLSGCLPDSNKVLTTDHFLSELTKAKITFQVIPIETYPSLSLPLKPSSYKQVAFESNGVPFVIIERSSTELVKWNKIDSNSSNKFYHNENLTLSSNAESSDEVINYFESLKPPLSYRNIGLFIYPLSACFLIAIFVIAERVYSLRRGLTFPRKVEKALRSGEFPSKNWKKKSSAERISLVAINQSPSQEALLAYSRLEIAALEKGLFLLEVVVTGAPLIGLLGTATGLVKVFSSIPANSLAGNPDFFSEGIALALLTTIIGLAIAIPALIGHAYLCRLVDKRTASLDWLTARLIDAIGKNKNSLNS